MIPFIFIYFHPIAQAIYIFILSFVLSSFFLSCSALQYWASAKLCGVEQRAPPIFGRAAITLGIGPLSSLSYFPHMTFTYLHTYF